MANNTIVSTAERNAMLDAATALLNGGSLELYDGAQPAGPGTAVTTQVLGATLTLNATAFGAAAAGVATANAITSGVAGNGITPTWARLKSSGGTAHIDCSVGTSGCDITLGAFTAGTTVGISALTITHPA